MLALTPEDTLLLLTSLAYPNREQDDRLRRLLAGAIAWDVVLWRSERYRTTPQLWYHLDRLHLADAVPASIQTYLTTWCALSALRSRVLYAELATVLDAFERHRIAYYLLKGTPLSLLFYPTPFMRPMVDLDFMVRPEQAEAAARVVRHLGYAHALWDPDTNRVTPVETLREPDDYELPILVKAVWARLEHEVGPIPRRWGRQHLKCYMGRDGRVSFAAMVDLHINLSTDFDLADVWRGVARVRLLDRDVPVQSPSGMLWFLASRLYHEAFQFDTVKLAMLADLHTILVRRATEIDWDDILAIGSRYGLQPSLFYVLSQLRALTGAEVPEQVTAALAPGEHGFASTHDWGDIAPKLFGRAALHPVTLA